MSSLKERKSTGSAGYDEQKRMISERIIKINNLRTEVTQQENKINFSIKNLTKQIQELI